MEWGEIDVSVIHLGKNPVRGGNPASDRIIIDSMKVFMGEVIFELFICDRVDEFIINNVRKIGIIIRA